jgi:Tfp pilus assembly protein PilF
MNLKKDNLLSQKSCLLVLLVLFLTFLAYSSSLKNGFTNWDDDTHLLNNINVLQLNLENLKAIFTKPVDKVYIPLTQLSFALEYHFFKANPFVYHLDNLLLHLGVVFLIYTIGRRLGLSEFASLLGSLIFGIHPMHVESVAWITERKDVLYSVFYLLALLSYLKYIDGQKKAYYLSLVFGLLSMLAKPMALSLPLILFLLDWMKGRKWTKASFLDKLPHFFYVVVIGWQTYQYQARIPGNGDVLQSFLIWIWTLTFYIKKFLFPFVLTPLYPLPDLVSIFIDGYLTSIFILLILITVLIRFRRNQWVIFAFLFFFLSIFFLLRFDNLKDQNMVADRFMYLPSLGFCLCLSVASESLLKNSRNMTRWLTIVFLTIMGMILLFQTHQQTKIWKDGLNLWSHVIQNNPNSPLAFLNRGNAYNEGGRYDLALKDYAKVTELDPNYFKSYNNRGAIYFLQGDNDKALSNLNKAIELDSSYADAYSNRGNVYSKLGQIESAIKDYSQAIVLNPVLWKAYVNRGSLYKSRNQFELALNDYNKALTLNNDYADGYQDRGTIYLKLRKFDLAIADFKKVIELNPNNQEAFLQSSIGYYLKKEYDNALKDAVKAQSLGLQVDQGYIKGLHTLTGK